MKVHDIRPREDNTMFVIADIDAMAEEKKLSIEDRIRIKRSFEVAGLLDASPNVVLKAAPVQASKGAADLIFAELELIPQRDLHQPVERSHDPARRCNHAVHANEGNYWLGGISDFLKRDPARTVVVLVQCASLALAAAPLSPLVALN